MRRLSATIIVFVLCGISTVAAQDYKYSLSVFGSYTTSSKIFQHPNDIDEIMRNHFLPINNIFGGGLDIRRNFPDVRVQFGLSIEYQTHSRQYSRQGTHSAQIPVREGYSAYPLELSAYFNIPVGLDKTLFYIGGGGGIYFGTRRYEEAGIISKVVEIKPSVGIDILCGVEYQINSRFSVRGEWKFRDVHFKVTNRFIQDAVFYNGYFEALNQEPMHSRINIDGMTFNIGTVYYF